MKSAAKYPFLAVLFLVVLRMSIGWQFLYEGLWKKGTQSTPNPWTSEGYLKQAQGPLRDVFRNMTGDPDDLNWLNYQRMSERWYAWRNRFAKHYRLDDKQLASLNTLLDGNAAEDTDADKSPPAVARFSAVVELDALPPDIVADLARMNDLSANNSRTAEETAEQRALLRKYRGVRYDVEQKRLAMRGPLLPAEEDELLGLVDVVATPNAAMQDEYFKRPQSEEGERVPADEKEVAFYKAVKEVARGSRRLPYRHQLAAALLGDPEHVGVKGVVREDGAFEIIMGTHLPGDPNKEQSGIVYGKIQEYKDLAASYNELVKNAEMKYQHDHAAKLSAKLAGMRAELVPPIRALDAKLQSEAMELLRPDQLARGRLSPPPTQLYQSDMAVTWGLIVLGALLIAGWFSRIAALLGAVMVLSFYLVTPPWPGLPEVAGPEHSYIVNKNLIEVVALLALAALPTGRWFGIDAIMPWGRKAES